MNSVLQEIAQFFFDVERKTQDLGISVQVEIPIYEESRLATFRSTEFRYPGPPVRRFLKWRRNEMDESRSKSGPVSGGVWLEDAQLFDFALSVDEGESNTAIERCDCGFYGLWERDGQVFDVALRYEADFLNIGSLWAAHPTFHLQWDPVAQNSQSGATEVRQRVGKMLPTHFFEFCTRHFTQEVWEAVFAPAAENIATQTELINEVTKDADKAERRTKFDDYWTDVRQWTETIVDSCDIEPTYEWASDDVSALLL